MGLFTRFFSTLNKLIYGSPSEYDRVINHPYATATTPDDLIAAAIIENIAKNFDDWVMHQNHKPSISPEGGEWYKKWTVSGTPANYYSLNRILLNEKKGIKVAYKFTSYHYDDVSRSEFHVNEVPLSPVLGCKIIDAHNKISLERERLERVAREAKKKMEENEKKWDLAEKLLGMKRNEFGALGPANPCTEEGITS